MSFRAWLLAFSVAGAALFPSTSGAETDPGSNPVRAPEANPIGSAETSAAPLELDLAGSAAATPTSLALASASGPSARPSTLRFDWTRDGVLTGTATAVWLGTEAVFKHSLAPTTCRWCDGDRLNPVDRWGRGLRAGKAERTMDTLSNVVDFGVLPLAALGTQAMLAYRAGASDFISEDAVMVVEATVMALVVNQAVKFAVGRERPFIRELPISERESLRDPADNNLSFFSGHSSFAFAVAVAAGTVSELRGYEDRWLVWAIGLPVAASVPLLRMASDRHYLSDVVTGSAVGAAFGVAVPLLLHPRIAQLPVQVSVGPTGVGVSGEF